MTGGSSGLGLAVSVALTKGGADVSIVARNEERLAKALAELEARSFASIRPWIVPILFE